MKTPKGILAAGAILLLTSLSVSPILTATPTPDDSRFSVADIISLDSFYGPFLNDLAKVKTLDGLHKLVDDNLMKWHNHPFFRCLHRWIVHATIERHLLMYRSLRTTCFVISMGTINKLFYKQNIDFGIYRPLTLWFYGNQANPFSKSRTFIIDLSPFSIRNVGGRQIGLMHNFYGFYISSYRPLLGGEHTFFFGHAQRIRVIDLSPFN
jgi:hypothetical protein